MSKPTREEMVEKIEEWKDGCGEGLPDNKSFCIACSGSKECDAMLQAIREALTAKSGMVRVSRKQIAELLNIGHQFAMETMGDGGKMSYSEDLTLALDEMQDKLIELGIEVGDNSEVSRRTSDKEGE